MLQTHFPSCLVCLKYFLVLTECISLMCLIRFYLLESIFSHMVHLIGPFLTGADYSFSLASSWSTSALFNSDCGSSIWEASGSG